MKNNNEHNESDQTIHEELCAYVLGELAGAEAERIELLLTEDADLRAEKARLEATIGLVAKHCSGNESLSLPILEALEREAEPRDETPVAKPWHMSRPLQVAAGFVAIATGLIAGREFFGEPGPVSGPERGVTVGKLEYEESLPSTVAEEEKPSPRVASISEEPILKDAEVTRPLGRSSEESKTSAFGKKFMGTSTSTQARAAMPAREGQELSVAFSSGIDSGSEGIALLSAATEETSGITAGQAGASRLRFAGQGDLGKGSSEPRFLSDSPFADGKTYRGPGDSVPPTNSKANGSPGDFTLNEKVSDQLKAKGEMRERMGRVGSDGGQLPVEWSSTGQSYDERTAEARAQRYLDGCIRIGNETPAAMFFRFWGDNAFELTQLDAQSTFSVDVDTASYTLARRYLMEGRLPEKAQIRTEEFLNYFKPDLPAPTEGTFAIHTELAPSRYGRESGTDSQLWMLRVGLRGKDVAKEERKALTLTFVVDTSGSMKQGNRMGLVKHALRLLVSQLDSGDSIAIVAFNNSASVILPMTSIQHRDVIEAALYGLQPNGGTNAEGGLKLGYEVAAAALTGGAHNRVVFLSDGVANVGQVDQDRINGDVSARREAGIFLNTIGVGMGNHNDTFLEQLANKGDGLCNYVDSAQEAKRALVDNFTGAFETIARDAKVQVEFDPAQVYRYRLLGYENRAIADADFRNDSVDAGEVGAGHQVVALYELELTGDRGQAPLAQVRLRWKAPTGMGRDPFEDNATEMTVDVSMESAEDWGATSVGYRRSVMVAQFAEILRRSMHARFDSLDRLLEDARRLYRVSKDEDFGEFIGLLQRSRRLILNSAPEVDVLSNCIDSLRRNRILRAQLEDLRRTDNEEVLQQLERNNRELEEKIRDLIRGELGQKSR